MKTPQDIKNYLDKSVIGQDRAKKILSVATYNHWQRLQNPDVKLRKSNVMLVGPSGSGKTLLLQTLADLMNVPFHCADATSLTAAGYVGQDIESILQGLVSAADGNIEKAEKGIIFLDEFDKLRKSNTGGFSVDKAKDIGGESVQQGLLKMLEGSEVSIPEGDGDNHPQRGRKTIDTTNILFILGGAFVGLADKNSNVTTEDLINYGIIPEVLGRVPVVAQLYELTAAEMRRVLTESKISPLTEYKTLFSLDDISLEFCDSALDKIVEKAILKKTGSRSLRSIIEDCLTDTMFEIPSLKGQVVKVLVTAESVDKTEGPRIYKLEKSKRQQRRIRSKNKSTSEAA